MKLWTILVCLLSGSLALAQEDVQFLTVTSTDGINLIEFRNPPSGPYGTTRVIGRLDRYPLAPDDVDLGGLAFVVDVSGTEGERGFVVHTGLQNGVPHFYTAFVNDGQGNYSPGKNVQGVPVDTSGSVLWRFSTGTGATAMSPPGIGSVVLVLSNDNNLYPVERGIDGGSWAEGAFPLAMNLPAQHRAPVIPAAGITDAENLTFIASQDGMVRGVDADTGGLLWTSEFFGLLQAAPAGWLSVFSGEQEDLVLIGTRNGGTRNAFLALEASNGQTVWRFDDPQGQGIGIVSGGATIDYLRRAAYFASHEIVPGADSVWAVDLVTGQKIWSISVGDVTGSPVQRGSYLYVGSDDGRIHSIDVQDGSHKLNFPFDTGDGITKGFVFPNFSGDDLYLSTENRVWRLRDVEPVVIKGWSHAGIPRPSIPVYPPGRQYLWVGSSDGRLYQIDVTTGNPSQPPDTKWVALTDGSAGVGSPSYDLANGLVYVGTENGAVFAVRVPF